MAFFFSCLMKEIRECLRIFSTKYYRPMESVLAHAKIHSHLSPYAFHSDALLSSTKIFYHTNKKNDKK